MLSIAAKPNQVIDLRRLSAIRDGGYNSSEVLNDPFDVYEGTEDNTRGDHETLPTPGAAVLGISPEVDDVTIQVGETTGFSVREITHPQPGNNWELSMHDEETVVQELRYGEPRGLALENEHVIYRERIFGTPVTIRSDLLTAGRTLHFEPVVMLAPLPGAQLDPDDRHTNGATWRIDPVLESVLQSVFITPVWHSEFSDRAMIWGGQYDIVLRLRHAAAT